MVSGRCVESGLKYSGELKSSWTKLLKESISLEGGRGEMNVLRTRGDGNYLFRSVGIALTGLDSDYNQEKLRQLAVDSFEESFLMKK